MRNLPRKTDPLGDFGLPEVRRPAESGVVMTAFRTQAVVIAVDDPHRSTELRRMVSQAGYAVAGPDQLGLAAVVLMDGARITDAVGAVRHQTRTDAAIVFVVDPDDAKGAAEAHAAGAFACIRFPCAEAELSGLIGSALDATAAKVRVADLRKELDLQTHLASIGRMSSGLAHELGNPLSAAVMSLTFLRMELARLAESERLLEEIAGAPVCNREEMILAARTHLAEGSSREQMFDAVEDTHVAYERIGAILTSLRALVGQGSVRSEEVDLMQLVRDVRRWAAEALHGVTVEEEGAPIMVRADRALLGQIVLNLATNGALAAKSLSAPRVRFHVYASGPNAVISIRDNGPGIPDAMQDKLFEPFFTTRRGRGGTGLGLSLCREYARQMGAELSFWSVLGRGACFRVQLPRAT